MKNNFLAITMMLMVLGVSAQTQTENQTSGNHFLVAKAKLGISQMELGNDKLINGNLTQLEVLLSHHLSKKYRLEYGIGFSQFNGNDVHNNDYVYFKNNNLRLPVNLLHSMDFTKNTSLLFGLGTYGIYYARTNMMGYYNGSGAGVNVGISTQLGAHFNVSEKTGFSILAEVQRELTKIHKADQVSFRERMNALLSLNFVFKL